MMNRVDLSIIILCYCAGEAIRDFAAKAVAVAASLTPRYEIILVANYLERDVDCTKTVAEELSTTNPRIKALCLRKLGMMGWDLKTGLEIARGEYICIIDGDGQFPLGSITTCYHAIESGGYDLVKTYRNRRFDGLYRTLLSAAYNRLFSLVFPGLHCRDVNSKPKIMTRSAYERMQLTADDWFIDAEIMLNVRRHKMTFCEFPVDFEALAGRPSFIRCSAVLEFVKNLLVYRLREFRIGRHGR